MPTWDTFERYKRRGLDARRAGQWGSARTYLLEAAREMVGLAKAAGGGPLENARRETAERLMALAKDCEAAERENRPAKPAAGDRRRESTAEADGDNDGSRFAVKERPDVTFDDVAGLEDVKADIRLKMLLPFQHPDLAERFDVRPGGGVLMHGPPGTGKTMLARATAGELDATFFTVSPADILSKWVGDAEQNVKALFDAAAAEERAVIFIDEIEALVPARDVSGGGGGGGSGVMQRVVPQILQGMEGFGKKAGSPVLFMGATNVPWQLDPAVLRPGRFDTLVHVPLPDAEARRALLDLYLAHRPLAADVDLDALATDLAGHSGADIKSLCDRAAAAAFLTSIRAGEPGTITPPLLAATLAETRPSVTPAAAARYTAWP